MKEFDVSLLLIEPTKLMHEKVAALLHNEFLEKRWNGRKVIDCFLRRETELSASELIDSLLLDSQFQELLALSEGGYIRLGVFFDSATCNVEINSSVIAKLEQHKLGILITCYPSFDEQKRVTDLII